MTRFTLIPTRLAISWSWAQARMAVPIRVRLTIMYRLTIISRLTVRMSTWSQDI